MAPFIATTPNLLANLHFSPAGEGNFLGHAVFDQGRKAIANTYY